MYQFYSAFLETLAAAVFLIPAFWLYGRTGVLRKKLVLPCLVFACYLAAVFALVGVPNVTYIRFDVNLNWIPFVGMAADLRNACLNVLLFLPLGIFLPVLWEEYRRWRRTVSMGLELSCFIEFIQIFTFRATDVDDLITNTLGTLLGFLLAKLVTRDFSRLCSIHSERKDLATVSLTVIAVMLFGHPFTSAVLWEILR